MKRIVFSAVVFAIAAFAQEHSVHRFNPTGTLTGPRAGRAADIGLEYVRKSLRDS